MESKICVVSKTEKSIDNFYSKYRECKPCNFKRNIKHYKENNDKISIYQKLYYETNREKPYTKTK